MQHRDLIVIGASAGGIEALKRICAALPESLDAAILVVVHTSAQSERVLARILDRAGPLPAEYATDGGAIRTGRIYVAPPDYHMLVDDRHLRVIKGPQENRHRPAIDPTFRSAAYTYGPRAIGVILTGSLDDGTSGLMVIRSRGGEAVVQDPESAMFASMPRNALSRVPDAHVAPLQKVPELLVQLVSESIEAYAAGEHQRAYAGNPDQRNGKEDDQLQGVKEDLKFGEPSPYACPECSGVLWEIDQSGFLRYRCRVGHAYTAQYLGYQQRYAIEAALWAALRGLEETASLYRRLAARAHADGVMSVKRFTERAADAEANANTLREFLLQVGAKLTEPAEPKEPEAA